MNWLVAGDAWLLWSICSKRETLRLLVLQGRRLDQSARDRLEAAILVGPSRATYPGEIEPPIWQDLVDRWVWLALAKLKSSGQELGRAAAKRLEALSEANPTRKLANDARDEFSTWISGTGDPEFEKHRVIDVAPLTRSELVAWLKIPPHPKSLFHDDTWRETCRDRFFQCALALCDLARGGEWPAERWCVAFQAWKEKGRVQRLWRLIAPLVQTMPDDTLKDVAPGLAWWIEGVSKSLDRHEGIFLDLCQRVLAIPLDGGDNSDQPLLQAINHPIGHITEALMSLWFKREPNDGDGLPTELEPYFTQLCDTEVARFRHGRVLLASRLIALFRVDRPWTETHVLPLFDWTVDPTEARAAWEGFLWSPRLYGPLLIALKEQLLETAHHYEEFGEHAREFAMFLTYAAMDPVNTHSSQDFQAALEMLPLVGLTESAKTLAQAIEGTGERGADFWANRVQPFWQNTWPKSRDRASKSIAQSLARVCIAAGDQFPAAVTAVSDWLQPLEYPDFVVQLLHESGLSARFPNAALHLLNAVIDDQPSGPSELKHCLTAISLAEPALLQDPRYRLLVEYTHRHDT